MALRRTAKVSKYDQLFLLLLLLPLSCEANWFKSLLDPVTAAANSAYPQHQGLLNPVEIDACRMDPLIWDKPGGCESMVPMKTLTDIGFLRVIYTPGTHASPTCAPAIMVKFDVANKNITSITDTSGMGPFVGDVCEPLGISNSSRLTLEDALSLAHAKAGPNFTTFSTINVRLASSPCVSQASMIFTSAVDPANPMAGIHFVVVGMTSKKVCKTLNTVPYMNGTVPFCNTQHAPICY